MNAYQKLSKHLNDHVYKKGKFKGDAPLEGRGKSYIRVTRVSADVMAVNMYNTNILTAYEDGRIRVDLGRWYDSNTTKRWINYTFSVLRYPLSLTSKSVQSMSQQVMYTRDGYYLYYNGMEFDAEGRLLTEPKPFEAKRINKAEAKEFAENLEVSGFKNMYQVLYGIAAGEDKPMGYRQSLSLVDKLTDADYASSWAEIIAQYKYDRRWTWDSSLGHAKGEYKHIERDNAQKCWTRLMSAAKSGMYETIKTEVTVVRHK
jgi:hypothetical protein